MTTIGGFHSGSGPFSLVDKELHMPTEKKEGVLFYFIARSWELHAARS